ncbi:ferrichrome transport ATP-binding protein FhuC [Salmonella enterica subsp. arizonae]|uniref:Ferrichrome transport ATP-binding protein FhuC n=1 Tax=Salmonella enterica subsp. arizonae TaxID=59203 RepID=A0A379S9U0_SALER|nr:ferrichrome transport ATP-binding protein FhuC [Salmonella enterica subsp. arizonae]
MQRQPSVSNLFLGTAWPCPFLQVGLQCRENHIHPDTTFALRSVAFRVPGRTLLHPLSLTFPAGKVDRTIGHNGSGKSTLLKMLGRHQPPSEGDILLDNQAAGELEQQGICP